MAFQPPMSTSLSARRRRGGLPTQGPRGPLHTPRDKDDRSTLRRGSARVRRSWQSAAMPVADHTQSTQRAYATRPLTRTTWDAFARLVEGNNGVWGGCWCMGFHPEGFSQAHTPGGNRGAKESLVRARQVHQVLVFDGDEAVGWCQYGTPVELPNIKNPAAYEKGLDEEPDW